MNVKEFIQKNFKHFNAAALVDAAEGWIKLLDDGGKMFLTLAGAMSTAELGITLAEMIRRGKVHAICCTGANLEEDIFNLVGSDGYGYIAKYRDLTPQDEKKIQRNHEYRVTDTIITEKAMTLVEDAASELWFQSDKRNQSHFPHEYLYAILLSGKLKKDYKSDPRNSWMVAAAEKNLPIYVPGWEDSTLGNIYASFVFRGKIKNVTTVKGGIDYMVALAKWYERTVGNKPSIGFFQIGGGIAGDFPICVVPMLHADLNKKKIPLWAYFCQISDSTTSYGGYSGALPNEKITWDKIGPTTPSFVIESDASIVAPLIFAYVLEGSVPPTTARVHFEMNKNFKRDTQLKIAAEPEALPIPTSNKPNMNNLLLQFLTTGNQNNQPTYRKSMFVRE